MKVFFLLSSMLILASCGGESTEQSPNGLGGVISAEQTPLSSEDVNRLKMICTAVAEKATRLRGMIGTPYTFSYKQKACSADDYSAAQDVLVKLESDADRYKFQVQNTVSFPFTNPEDAQSGNLGKLCTLVNSGTTSLSSPIAIGNGIGLFFGTSATEEHCTADSESYCLELYTGSITEDGTGYKVSSQEWSKYKVRGRLTGFFTERTLQTLSDCETGDVRLMQASLK